MSIVSVNAGSIISVSVIVSVTEISLLATRVLCLCLQYLQIQLLQLPY